MNKRQVDVAVRHRHIGIRVQLSILFAFSMIVVAAVLMAVHYTQARSYLVEFALRDMALARQAVVARTRAYFNPAAQITDALGELNLASFSDAERESLFFQQAEQVLDRNPQIFTAFMAFEDGTYVRTGGLTSTVRQHAGIPADVETERARGIMGPDPGRLDRSNAWSYLDGQGEWRPTLPKPWDYDARARSWYATAIRTQGVHWTEVFQWVNGRVGMLATRALRDNDDRIIGVVGVTLALDEISDFLSSVSVSEHAITFIAREDGRVVSHPDMFSMLSLDASDDALLSFESAAIGSKYSLEQHLFRTLNHDEPAQILDIDGRRVVGAATLMTEEGGLDTVLYMGVPLGDFVGFAVRANIRASAVSLVVVVALLLIGLRISRAIAAPIEQLASLATDVHKKGLDAATPHPGSIVREIDNAGQAFNAMVGGLREREMIRDLFGRYVPEEIAQRLIREGGSLDPVSVECTILFTDIEGFTTLTERLGPTRLVAVLNEFFSVATAVIESHHGVITQFQGDAILAIFNAPSPDPDHACNAIRAAAELQDAVGRQSFDGHEIAIRVGVNTGEVVAGSVGAEGRLNYTVHGDAVNLAARLEALNKELGTRVLVSEATRKLCPDAGFEARGDVAVRGQSERVTVYTLADQPKDHQDERQDT